MISFDGVFTQDDLRATLKALGGSVFFVQIGAMDGITHDPLHPFVTSLNWQGLLVEPVPYLHQKLRDTYKAFNGLTFAQTAIADFDGTIEMMTIDPAAQNSGLFEPGGFGLSTLMPEKGLLGSTTIPQEAQEIFKAHTLKIEVPCCRLRTLLKTHNVRAIDVLVIDTEGADWMIARQLDLDAFAPRVIYLEYNHLSPYEKTACAAHFHNHGYRIYLEKDNAENFLAVKQGK